ncbi:hypothetical protein EWB00_000125 [Schistosoma japonicum]|uniref:Uncharacterized protein n=1 Tax=Schistosoma japonicum TaxID=6182 RepID=A0A4Z2DL01_SCHJA|nr:hypothetical protein EWB00_000125 [Schistosoma japonicum]TNN16841.1 hypothetical protein EWB00_000125 [Schistosoma japonicum]
MNQRANFLRIYKCYVDFVIVYLNLCLRINCQYHHFCIFGLQISQLIKPLEVHIFTTNSLVTDSASYAGKKVIVFMWTERLV